MVRAMADCRRSGILLQRLHVARAWNPRGGDGTELGDTDFPRGFKRPDGGLYHRCCCC